MFTLQWSDPIDVREAVCSNSGDAWSIYWALKESMRSNHLLRDAWIHICHGTVPCNPERGNSLPNCLPGEGPTFVLKAKEEEIQST